MKERVIIILAAIIAIALLSIISLNTTGLFGLGIGSADINSASTREITKTNQVSLSLKYTTLKKTTLDFNIINYNITDCPSDGNIEFVLKNNGDFNAERISVIFPSNIQVFACKNCIVKNLSPREEANVSALVCKGNTIEDKIAVISANANDLNII